jgi:hypothetical protein
MSTFEHDRRPMRQRWFGHRRARRHCAGRAGRRVEEPMKRIQIHKSRKDRRRRDQLYTVLSLDPRDPEILRARALSDRTRRAA